MAYKYTITAIINSMPYAVDFLYVFTVANYSFHIEI